MKNKQGPSMTIDFEINFYTEINSQKTIPCLREHIKPHKDGPAERSCLNGRKIV